MSEWKEWNGTPEQIDEMQNCKNGFLLRSSDHMYENEIIYADADFSCIDAFNVTQYLICNPHPLAKAFIQWVNTGQPVWWRAIDGGGTGLCHKHFPPFAHPDKFEYSFTEFKEEV